MNRRTHFRAALTDVRDGVLIVGHDRRQVRLFDISATGLSVLSESKSPLLLDGEGVLRLNDGECERIRVKHCTIEEDYLHIGLQRLDPPPGNARGSLTACAGGGLGSGVAYAVVLVLGMAIGLIAQPGAIQQRVIQALADAGLNHRDGKTR